MIKGKFLPDTPSEGYPKTVSSGESHSKVNNSKFCGPTKGNKDLPPNHTSNTPEGQYHGK